ncbi:hypothetical protein [Rhodohalobacter mucosus]|uniref:Uncharacterized protein n=1 Tax=Rhodohalobacter mucosus TaxID=2079485 RepID=A0A316TRB5_9BACT|nr:hypothetical protein [Rhodohalobacter mucosus]PWN06358.1 hypothetical protein DDZ15_11090 [Rhodohalobacter mucosus]
MDTENKYRAVFTNPKAKVSFIAPTILTGLIYLILQWFVTQNIVDSIFVGLLFGSTVILVFGLSSMAKHVTNRGLNFFSSSMDLEAEKEIFGRYQEYCAKILHFPGMMIAGLLYGTAVSLTPFLFDIWPEHFSLKLTLAVFLFAVNFVTGAAVYSLVKYIEQTYKIAPLINIDLWQANSGKTDFLLSMTRKMAVLASVYIALSLTSVLFSLIPINSIVISYGIFSGMILLSILFITPAPVVQKLKEEKIKMLNDLDDHIHDLLPNSYSDLNSGDTIELERMKSLLELREKIENLNVWPFKFKSIVATLSVIFFSALPILVRTILEVFFN